MPSQTEVKKLCKDSLEGAKVTPNAQNGKDFYAYFFTTHPDLRRYFKGAENFSGDDVQKSDRFAKLGQGLLEVVQKLVDTYEDEGTFRKGIQTLMDQHVGREIDPQLWKVFWTVWVNFLETKTKQDDASKTAWANLGENFAKESWTYLKAQGLPSGV